MGKKFLTGCVMSSVECVQQAASWSRKLTQMRARGPGDTDNAMRGIERDYGKKEEWWQVSLQLLTIPPQKVAWTLRTAQFTGQEIFTMGGEERFIKAIDFGGSGEMAEKKSEGQIGPGKKKGAFLKVIK